MNNYYSGSINESRYFLLITIILLLIGGGIPLQAQPDLIVTSVSITDATGPVIGWSTTVKNQGNQATNGSVKLRMFITSSGFSQDFATWINTNGLTAGQSYTFTHTSDLTGIPNIGKNTSYGTRAVVDPDQTIDETNESNNTKDGGFVTIIGPAPTISSFTPNNAKKGETVTINGNNFGATKVSTSNVKFGSISAVTSSWSNTQIKCTVSSLLTEGNNYTISVTTWSGQVNSATQFHVNTSTGVNEGMEPVAREFSLHQNYPNPFNPTTTIGFTVEKDGYTSLKIYNALGQPVATLVDGLKKAGEMHSVVFDATLLPSGIYFARLQNGIKSQINKIMLVK